MTSLRDLRYNCGYGTPTEHPQRFMDALGIKYTLAVPQSIADQWWFLGCSNVPSDLPAHISDMDAANPRELVGWGLSIEMADRLTAARAAATPDNQDAPLSPIEASVPPAKP